MCTHNMFLWKNIISFLAGGLMCMFLFLFFKGVAGSWLLSDYFVCTYNVELDPCFNLSQDGVLLHKLLNCFIRAL